MKTTITFDPATNLFDLVADDARYLKADYNHARMWLRPEYTPSETRRLLLHARVLGALANLPLTIHQ